MSYSEEIQKWIKRSNRKEAKLISTEGAVYNIVYFDKYESGDFMYWAEDIDKAIQAAGIKIQ